MSADMNYTVEEINFICAAYAGTREDTIAKIYSVMPEIQEDKDMLAIGARVIIKLDEMSDETFQECHFNELYSE